MPTSDVQAALTDVARLYETGEVMLKLRHDDDNSAMCFVFEGHAGGAPPTSDLERSIGLNGGRIAKCAGPRTIVIYQSDDDAAAAQDLAETHGLEVFSVQELQDLIGTLPEKRMGKVAKWCWSLRHMNNWLELAEASAKLSHDPREAINELCRHHGKPCGEAVDEHIRFRLLDEVHARLKQRCRRG